MIGIYLNILVKKDIKHISTNPFIPMSIKIYTVSNKYLLLTIKKIWYYYLYIKEKVVLLQYTNVISKYLFISISTFLNNFENESVTPCNTFNRISSCCNDIHKKILYHVEQIVHLINYVFSVQQAHALHIMLK